jgi:hypothetical protein
LILSESEVDPFLMTSKISSKFYTELHCNLCYIPCSVEIILNYFSKRTRAQSNAIFCVCLKTKGKGSINGSPQSEGNQEFIADEQTFPQYSVHIEKCFIQRVANNLQQKFGLFTFLP